MAASRSGYKAMITTEIRVCLSNIPERTLGKLLGLQVHQLRTIEAASSTTIRWDNESLTAYISGEPKAAKQAYNFLLRLIARFAIANAADYRPESSMKMFGREIGDGICFCQTHSQGANPGDNSSSGKGSGGSPPRSLVKGPPRRFVIYPAYLEMEEEFKSRVVSGSLWRQPHFVTYEMREAVVRDASVVLRNQMMNPPTGLGNYLKVGVNLGKNVFFENDREEYDLDSLKLITGDFRHVRLDKEITTVFKKQWREPWIPQLRALLPKLGYERLGVSKTTVELCHKEQRSDGKFHDVIWSAIPRGQEEDGTGGILDFIKSRIRNKCAYRASVFNPATYFDLNLETSSYERVSDTYSQEAQARLHNYYRFSHTYGLLANPTADQCKIPFIDLTVRVKKETTWVRAGVKISIIEFKSPRSTFEVKLSSDSLKNIMRINPMVRELPDISHAVSGLLWAAEEISDELMVLDGEFLANERMELRSTERDNTTSSFGAPTRRSTSGCRPRSAADEQISSLNSGVLVITNGGVPISNAEVITTNSTPKSSGNTTPEPLTPPPTVRKGPSPSAEKGASLTGWSVEWKGVRSLDKVFGKQPAPEVPSLPLPGPPTIPGRFTPKKYIGAKFDEPMSVVLVQQPKTQGRKRSEIHAPFQEKAQLADATKGHDSTKPMAPGARPGAGYTETRSPGLLTLAPHKRTPGPITYPPTFQVSQGSTAFGITSCPPLSLAPSPMAQPPATYISLIDSPHSEVECNKISRFGLLMPTKTYRGSPTKSRLTPAPVVDPFSTLSTIERAERKVKNSDPGDLLRWSPEMKPTMTTTDKMEIWALESNDDLLLD